MKHAVLITGAAGYIGTMLVRRFAARADVERIIGVDKEPIPDLIRKELKLVYLNTNTADDWEGKVREYHPDIVTHSAWQIREMYGAQDMEWEWNIGGSDKVFDFSFSEPSVTRLVDFSTVSSYGAFPSNTTGHHVAEDEPFRKAGCRYAEERRVAEEHLKQKYDAYCATPGVAQKTVAVVRPAAITGPRGRYMRIRFGLQSALAGQLKDSFVYRLVGALVAFVPVTPKWLRQFVHEDDVVNIVEILAFQDVVRPTSDVGRTTSHMGAYEAFNLCPPGAPVLGEDMAKAVGKHTLPVAPGLVRDRKSTRLNSS